MGKGWSILFAVVFLASFGSLAAAPFIPGWWLPKNIASYGGEVDNLFYIILGLTGFFFVLTEVILIYTMWTFGHDPARKAVYTHGNHRLELLWTVVPAAILLFIAFAQVRTWDDIKSRMPSDPDMVVQVSAKQWEWRIRHPAPNEEDPPSIVPKNPRDWAEYPQIDDVQVVNELHTWKNAKVKLYLKTQDVIHSFFLPNLRLKQDALPGKTIPMWFKATESNMIKKGDGWAHNENLGAGAATFEIACAELCGGRHYAMRGRLCVHPDEADYKAWLKLALAKQKSFKPEAPAVAGVAAAPNMNGD